MAIAASARTTPRRALHLDLLGLVRHPARRRAGPGLPGAGQGGAAGPRRRLDVLATGARPASSRALSPRTDRRSAIGRLRRHVATGAERRRPGRRCARAVARTAGRPRGDQLQQQAGEGKAGGGTRPTRGGRRTGQDSADDVAAPGSSAAAVDCVEAGPAKSRPVHRVTGTPVMLPSALCTTFGDAAAADPVTPAQCGGSPWPHAPRSSVLRRGTRGSRRLRAADRRQARCRLHRRRPAPVLRHAQLRTATRRRLLSRDRRRARSSGRRPGAVRSRGERPDPGRRRLARVGRRRRRHHHLRGAAQPARGQRAPPPPGRLRPALAPDRHQRRHRRPAAAVLRPMGQRRRAPPGRRWLIDPAEQDWRSPATSGSSTPTSVRPRVSRWTASRSTGCRRSIRSPATRSPASSRPSSQPRPATSASTESPRRHSRRRPCRPARPLGHPRRAGRRRSTGPAGAQRAPTRPGSMGSRVAIPSVKFSPSNSTPSRTATAGLT